MEKADAMIRNTYITTMDHDRNIISNGCIMTDKDKITAVGGGELVSCYEVSRVVDVRGKFVFLGMISTHSHLFQTMLKSLGGDKPLLDRLDSFVRMALHRFDGEMCHYVALTECMEATQPGTTTPSDYMYRHISPGLSDYVTQAMEDIGIRGIYGRGFTNTTNLPPEFKVAHHNTEWDMFDDVRHLYKKYEGYSRMSVTLAPGIIWDNMDGGYREMCKMADEMHIPLTMHVLESEDDDKYCREVKGGRTIPHLEHLGFIGLDFIAIHHVCMKGEDFDIFKQYDVKVNHNPVSNMIFASGMAPVEGMVKEGLTVSLACDGSTSNDTQDMTEVLKITAPFQKVHLRDAAAMPAPRVLELATLRGAKAVMREEDLEVIAAGMEVDPVIYDPFHGRSIPVHDPVSAIVYSSSQVSIESVMVGGVFVMEYKRMTMTDEEKVLYATQKAAEKPVNEVGLGNMQWDGKIGNLGLQEEMNERISVP